MHSLENNTLQFGSQETSAKIHLFLQERKKRWAWKQTNLTWIPLWLHAIFQEERSSFEYLDAYEAWDNSCEQRRLFGPQDWIPWQQNVQPVPEQEKGQSQHLDPWKLERDPLARRATENTIKILLGFFRGFTKAGSSESGLTPIYDRAFQFHAVFVPADHLFGDDSWQSGSTCKLESTISSLPLDRRRQPPTSDCRWRFDKT